MPGEVLGIPVTAGLGCLSDFGAVVVVVVAGKSDLGLARGLARGRVASAPVRLGTAVGCRGRVAAAPRRPVASIRWLTL